MMKAITAQFKMPYISAIQMRVQKPDPNYVAEYRKYRITIFNP